MDGAVVREFLHVRNIANNLVAVRAITVNGGAVKSENDEFKALKEGRVVASGVVDGSSRFLMEVHAEVLAYGVVAYGWAGDRGQLWHRWYAHLGAGIMAKLSKLVKEMNMKSTDASPFGEAPCSLCVDARMANASFDNSASQASETPEIFHVDFARPVVPTNKGRANHVLTMQDGFPGLKTVALLAANWKAGPETINKWEKTTGCRSSASAATVPASLSRRRR